METMKAVKEAIRHPYVWPGAYPQYVVMENGDMICPKCARKNFKQIAFSTINNERDGWKAIGAEVRWEGWDIPCPECGELVIESAYGAPDCNC